MKQIPRKNIAMIVRMCDYLDLYAMLKEKKIARMNEYTTIREHLLFALRMDATTLRSEIRDIIEE